MQRPKNDKQSPKGSHAEEVSSVPKLGPLDMHIPSCNPSDDG